MLHATGSVEVQESRRPVCRETHLALIRSLATPPGVDDTVIKNVRKLAAESRSHLRQARNPPIRRLAATADVIVVDKNVPHERVKPLVLGSENLLSDRRGCRVSKGVLAHSRFVINDVKVDGVV